MTDAPIEAVRPLPTRSLMSILYIPWVDRAIAVVAAIPFAVDLYDRWSSHTISFPRAILGLNLLVLILTMVFRRTPVRITPNPWFWLLAFAATYGTLAIWIFGQRGTPLVPSMASNVLAVISLIVLLWARFSLGRSIGFVPAQRIIITRGPYRFVRHPIYTGVFLSLLAYVLRAFSPINVALAATVVILFMIKSVVEEHFLRDDATYAAYLRQVRWRWLPGVA